MSYWGKMSLDQLAGQILCSSILENKKTSSSSVGCKTVLKKFRKENFDRNQLEVIGIPVLF